jgi:hypothetical protein
MKSVEELEKELRANLTPVEYGELLERMTKTVEQTLKRPNIEISRLEEAEKALGLKLYECQRNYILYGDVICTNERCTGYTTAYCLKLLLTKGEPIKAWNFEEMYRLADGAHGRTYVEHFRRYLSDWYRFLKAKGVEVREVELTKRLDGYRPHTIIIDEYKF